MSKNYFKNLQIIKIYQTGAEVTRTVGPRWLGADLTRGRGVQEFFSRWGRDGLGPRWLGAEVSRGRDGLGPKCPVTKSTAFFTVYP